MKRRARTPWRVRQSMLDAISPELARDLLIECFVEARMEAETGGARTWSHTDACKHREHATRIIKAAFKDLGYNFARPDAASCRMVMEQLSRDSRLAGTAAELVEHHVREYSRVIDALMEAERGESRR